MKKPRFHLVAIKLDDQQVAILEAEVKARQTEVQERVTRSSVLRQALVELSKKRST
jgi:hypothetical protein